MRTKSAHSTIRKMVITYQTESLLLQNFTAVLTWEHSFSPTGMTQPNVFLRSVA